MKRMSYKQAAFLYRRNGINKPFCRKIAEIVNNDYPELVSMFPDDWSRSVTIWGYFGLIPEDFREFFDAARRKEINPPERWKYVCGCAWNTVEIIKEIAREGEDIFEPESNAMGDGISPS